MKQLFENFTYKVNEQGERIDKPKNYDTWNVEFHKRIMNSARQHSKTWAILCEIYNKAETVTFTPDWMEFSKLIEDRYPITALATMELRADLNAYTDHMGETPQLSWFIATQIVDGVEVPMERPLGYTQYITMGKGGFFDNGCKEYQQAQSKVLYRGWRDVGAGEIMNPEGVKIMFRHGYVYYEGLRIATRNDFVKNGGELIFK